MGLFDTKYCDICGEKIKFLGNKKLEDGRMCKSCEAKLSPFFTGRRHTSLESIKEQLAYREENKDEVAAFTVTRTLGKSKKVLIDEAAKKFMVTSAKDIQAENPDVMSFSDITGCTVDTDESRYEEKTKDDDGNQVSYDPPRYRYSYSFQVILNVNNPYFDEIKIPVDSGVNVDQKQVESGVYNAEYNECLSMCNEIKETLLNARNNAGDEREEQKAVICPLCGATTVPDKKGCCEYCGGAIAG